MRVVSPDGREVTGRTRTMTERLKELTPSTPDLVDAGFLLALSALAFYGFRTTFDTYHFLFVGVLGVLLGMFAAHLAAVLRWHWLFLAVLVIAEFFLLGAAISLREDTIGGVIPTLDAFRSLASMLIGGWKDLVTTLPPLAGDGSFLTLPYAMGLVAGALGLWVARRSRRAAPALAVPFALLALVIVLGALQPAGVLVQGLGFAALAFCWLAIRTRRRRRLTGTGRSSRTGTLLGAAMVVGAVAAAALTGGLLPGADTTRFVLRTYVQPPVELKDLASPLVGFRKYSSATMKPNLNQTSLLKVEGAPAGSLLRFAVLDDFTGRSWSASADTGSRSGFRRLGSQLPDGVAGTPVVLKVTFLAGYASSRELGSWLPSLGEDTSIAFKGANLRTHGGTLRYNLETGQGVLSDGDRFREGDVLEVATVPTVQGLAADAVPGAASQVDAASYSFLSGTGQKWAGSATSAGQRVAQIAAKLKSGSWSDGTIGGETQYLPGHGEARLFSFVQGQQLVGSDEQYAATFALLCNQAGFPARVVFGAIVPQGGEVKGSNISAWVEVQTDQGWRAVPPATFIPDRNKHPQKQPESAAEDKYATYVPPPNPSRLNNGFDQLSDGDLAGTRTQGSWLNNLARIALTVLLYAGPPLGALILILGGIAAAKAVRRHRRRVKGSPSRQVAAGWDEVLDQATDMGIVVPHGATRLEQSSLIDHPQVTALADSANTAIFGLDDPAAEDARAFWTQVGQTRAGLLRSVNRRRRFRARFSPRSLLPSRIAAIQLPRLRRPPSRSAADLSASTAN
jgi:hypothetical protein